VAARGGGHEPDRHALGLLPAPAAVPVAPAVDVEIDRVRRRQAGFWQTNHCVNLSTWMPRARSSNIAAQVGPMLAPPGALLRSRRYFPLRE
jgi:hypothetical protein